MSTVRERAEVVARTPSCCHCAALFINGERDDVGRPLTDAEAASGFFATHVECRSKLDAFMAEIAAKGVFVEVGDNNNERG